MGQRQDRLRPLGRCALCRPRARRRKALLLARQALGQGWQAIPGQRSNLVGNRLDDRRKLAGKMDRLRAGRGAAHSRVRRRMDHECRRRRLQRSRPNQTRFPPRLRSRSTSQARRPLRHRQRHRSRVDQRQRLAVSQHPNAFANIQPRDLPSYQIGIRPISRQQHAQARQ